MEREKERETEGEERQRRRDSKRDRGSKSGEPGKGIEPDGFGLGWLVFVSGQRKRTFDSLELE